EVSKQLEKSLQKAGINILTKSEVQSVDTSGDLSKVSIKTAKGTETIDAVVVLSAVGITPNIENLGLEEVGVKTEKGRVVVDSYYKTNVEGVYAIGDIVQGQALAHVASAEGITWVEKIKGLHVDPIDYNNIPGCTYCSPEIASVGYTEKAAKEAGYAVKVGKFPCPAAGRACRAGANAGCVERIVDAKYGESLGARRIGAKVGEMLAESAVARTPATTGHAMVRAVHPHPTMGEATR